MYKYTNCELTPQVFAECMLQLFKNKQFTRSECVEAVQSYHKEHGGLCNRKTYTDTFKKASQDLRKNGNDLQNIIPGVWRLSCLEFDNVQNAVDVQDTPKELGEGNELVYCYYFPTYKKYAELQGQTEWACKVGQTTKNLWDHIYSQVRTCFPEDPCVAITIHCDNAKDLESLIQKVLRTRGKWMQNAPGTEWYITTPKEVEEIYHWVLPK